MTLQGLEVLQGEGIYRIRALVIMGCMSKPALPPGHATPPASQVGIEDVPIGWRVALVALLAISPVLVKPIFNRFMQGPPPGSSP